ncbi:hypothetical protein B0H17DRAFT_1117507 [Mycena rosella]|uniref:Uncharacterized protein n=1 Tax=Mycena rosella TaxID=1033263 RepID=A0AAD7B6I3_MYCRO|nr:hypothetical protein B0H17DRAFT_1117507 [Mycena rosella]
MHSPEKPPEHNILPKAGGPRVSPRHDTAGRSAKNPVGNVGGSPLNIVNPRHPGDPHPKPRLCCPSGHACDYIMSTLLTTCC